jgi:catechol 2,3-dioxygenase-like lactoylglutathione lyase family enzyme
MAIEPQFGFALEYVSDIEAVKRFYVESLGLEVEREHPTFVQFRTSFAIASDESMSGTRETELYWTVDDAEAAYSELSGKAEVSLPLTQMPFGKVFGVNDPEGQARYLVELARNRPSRQVS